MADDIYCGIGNVPKGKRRGTMRECVERNQVRYWGIKSIDPKLIGGVKKKQAQQKSIIQVRNELIKLQARKRKLIDQIKKEKNEIKKEEMKNEARKIIEDIKKVQRELTNLKGGTQKALVKRAPIKRTKKAQKPKLTKQQMKTIVSNMERIANTRTRNTSKEFGDYLFSINNQLKRSKQPVKRIKKVQKPIKRTQKIESGKKLTQNEIKKIIEEDLDNDFKMTKKQLKEWRMSFPLNQRRQIVKYKIEQIAKRLEQDVGLEDDEELAQETIDEETDAADDFISNWGIPKKEAYGLLIPITNITF